MKYKSFKAIKTELEEYITLKLSLVFTVDLFKRFTYFHNFHLLLSPKALTFQFHLNSSNLYIIASYTNAPNIKSLDHCELY